MLQHVPTSNVLRAEEEDDGDDRELLDPLPPLGELPSCEMTMVSRAVIPYIAGFVVRKLLSLKCSTCFDRLFASNTEEVLPLMHFDARMYDLIEMRDEGGLIKPSRAVIFICHQTEAVIKHMKEEDFCQRSLLCKIKLAVLNDSPVPFPDDHESGLNSHSLVLTKLVIDNYVKVRMHHLSNLRTSEAQGKKVRYNLKRTVILSHQ